MYYEKVNPHYSLPVLQTHYFYDIPFSDDDIYVKVTSDYVNRLDKVAYDYYDNVSLWWVIAQASNIRNPFNIPEGTILRVPPMSTLFKLRGINI